MPDPSKIQDPKIQDSLKPIPARITDLTPTPRSPQEAESQFRWVDEELVINTLRSRATPETVYWLLRQFMETGAESPVIETDRGKTIYIDFDRTKENITLYIGNTDNVLCIEHEKDNEIYALEIQERCEFIWHSTARFAVRRQMSAGAIQDQSRPINYQNQKAVPTLFFTKGKISACIFRTDLCTGETTVAPPEIRPR